MIIAITQQHINKGERGSSENCPLTHALRDAIPDYQRYLVGINVIFIGDWSFRLERWIQERIARYDEQGEMEPFEFDLKL